MTLPTLNRGDQASFFQRANQGTAGKTGLISDQIDPTQPQIQGLKRITDPLIPSENSSEVVKNFDPELYDLKPNSHLMRLIRALTGSAGIGGIRKQNFVARQSTSIGGANFVDLDAFYGALFNFRRNGVERMPQNLDGSTINPLTDAANSDIWDDVLSRDARFRSRIYQLARAINMGGSYAGLRGVAEAILSVEVDLVESWVKVDALAVNNSLITPTAKTYGQMVSQFSTWGNIAASYGALSGGQFGNGNTPQGNRGELVFTPRRIISAEESYQLMQVLQVLKPAHTQVTIANVTNQAMSPITPRSLAADSENWTIQSRITPANKLVQPIVPLYNNAGPYSSARPVFSEYVGESWSYNANVVKSVSYKMQNNVVTQQGNDETIIYQDGQQHQYKVSDGLMDTHKAISARLSGDGVVTTYPYAGNRVQYLSS
jgi:hypothetical protein